jgi:hypothetical protein
MSGEGFLRFLSGQEFRKLYPALWGSIPVQSSRHISSPVSFILKTVSKVIINPGLLHNHVCHMPGLYFSIDRKIALGERAIPHIIILLAVP